MEKFACESPTLKNFYSEQKLDHRWTEPEYAKLIAHDYARCKKNGVKLMGFVKYDEFRKLRNDELLSHGLVTPCEHRTVERENAIKKLILHRRLNGQTE